MAMQGSCISNLDVGSATVKLADDGTFNLIIGAADMGTGCDTILAQMVAECMDCSVDDVAVFWGSDELNKLFEERKKLDYIKTYKSELDKKRNLTNEISDCEQELQLIDFDIELLTESIQKLKKEYSNIDTNQIREIYEQANLYIEKIEKKFEDVVKFHNTMIENRISFLNKQLSEKQKKKIDIILKRDKLIDEKKNITIDLLDDGLLSDLNVLNTKIEKLTLEKGEVRKSIQLLEENEKERKMLEEKIITISDALNPNNINDKISIFNIYFYFLVKLFIYFFFLFISFFFFFFSFSFSSNN